MTAFGFREAVIHEADLWADVCTLARPTSPVDPLVTRYWWEQPLDRFIERRFVVERDAHPVGVATFFHPRWDASPQRWGIIGGELLPEHCDRATLGFVFGEMERRLTSAGARRIAARADEDDDVRIAAILASGFHEDRRGRRWELDLVANRERLLAMTEASRARMRAEGIQLRTLAADPDRDRYRKMWRAGVEAAEDEPSTLPYVEDTFEDYLRWIRSPGMHEDRFWIAREADDVVGISVLFYPPVRGVVRTSWTGTTRAVRGRGIARALKCETIAQAIALGVDRVRTGNDAANDPILHINATMGYRSTPGAIEFLKEV